MRAVIDTNILIQALIKPQGTVGPVLSRLAAGEYTLIYPQVLLDELVEKLALPRLRLKYSLDANVIEAVLGVITLRGQLVEPDRQVRICRDPDDNQIIEAALAGAASLAVSGDQDLLVLKQFERFTSLSHASFCCSSTSFSRR